MERSGAAVCAQANVGPAAKRGWLQRVLGAALAISVSAAIDLLGVAGSWLDLKYRTLHDHNVQPDGSTLGY